MKRRPLLLEQLEDRIFLDANPVFAVDAPVDNPGVEVIADVPVPVEDAAVVALDGEDGQSTDVEEPASDTDTDLPAEQNAEAADDSESAAVQLIVVDSRVHDSEQLVADIRESLSDDDGSVEVIVIDGQESGVDQLTEALSNRDDVEALHIFSYGNDGNLRLGSDTLTSDSLQEYGEELQSWQDAMTADGDILLYGCDIARSADGEAFVQQFAELTGADVAASSDTTGNETSGGDWDLEYSTGDIEATSLFQTDADVNWNGVLDPTPIATVNMPAEGLIEENIDFSVSFTNNGLVATPGQVGYGPYVDVYVPVGLNVQSAPTYGGAGLSTQLFTWDSATSTWYDGATPGSGTVIDPTVDFHPFDAVGSVIPVDSGVNDGDHWYVIELPFGSYTPEQPTATIDFTAELDEDAVLGVDGVADGNLYAAGDAVVGDPLTVTARAGFRFGTDSLDNPNSDPVLVQGSAASGNVTPQLLTITKTSNAPEGQTATGPNFPVDFTIVVDIAPDQVVDNLTLTDYLPDNAYYRDDYVVVGAAVQAGSEIPVAWQPNSAASGDNDFVFSFGAVAANSADGVPEITLTYSVYYGETDAAGSNVIPSDTGNDQSALNEANATGDYLHPVLGLQTITAGDVNSDDGGPGALDGDGSDLQHQLNSITVEKDVVIVSGAADGYTPGDTLEYTIDFEISDYFGFDNVVVTDSLGDGQHVLGTDAGDLISYNPVLTLYENGTTVTETWDLSTLSLVRGSDGITHISFDVSTLLTLNGDPNGQLLGDLFAGDTGTSDHDNSVNRPGSGTRGTIAFQTVIDQNYMNTAVGDTSIDSLDPIVNDVTISGDLLSTTLDPSDGTTSPDDSDGYLANGFTEEDTSHTEVIIEGISAVKDMPFLNGGSYTSGDVIQPGDVVTYRLTMTLSTGDLENFVLTDYLPLPVFDVAEFGTPAFANTIETGKDIDPASIDLTVGGQIYWGTGTDFQYANNIVFGSGDWPPQLSTDTAANSLVIDMGTFNSEDSNDGPWTVEVLITATVQNNPYADGLNLTNQAQWNYNNTFQESATTDDIAQIEVSSPEVLITKGIVATDGNGVFDPAGILAPADVTFNAPGSGPSLNISGAVDAGEMFADPIDSNMIDVDGSDLVTFAVSAYNVGGANAYGLEIHDTLAGTGFLTPASLLAMNLQVWRGDGSQLIEGVDYTASIAGGELSIEFDAVTGVLDGDRMGASPDALVGDDVFIITYDLQVDNETAIDADVVEFGSEHENTASILFYTGSLNDNGTPADPTDDYVDPAAVNWVDPADPPKDTALVTIAEPEVAKILLGTGIDDGINEATEAVVGETVTYRVTVTLPEGETPSLQVIDHLDQGLALVSIDSVVFSSGVSADNTFPVPVTSIGGGISYTENTTGRDTLTIDFGSVYNSESDDGDPETIVIEYTALVLNSAENQSTANEGGPHLNNGARADWEEGGVTQSSAVVQADPVSVIEPDVLVTKSVSINGNPAEPDIAAGDDGDTVEYTITIRHSSTSETGAFDVSLLDVVPGEVSGLAISTVNDNGGILDAGDFMLTGNTLSFDPNGLHVSADGTIDLAWDLSREITVTLTGALASSLNVGDLIENDAGVQWSSLPGATAGNSDLSGFVANADSERDGSDGSGGVNNYVDTDPADILVGLNSVEKILVNSEISTETDAPPTTNLAAPNPGDGINEGREAAIGETLTYQLVVTMAEGVSPNVHVVDTLDAGLSLVSIDSITFDPDISGGNSFGFPITDSTGSSDVSYTGNVLDIFLGNLTNGNNDNTHAETIVVSYTVMVTDVTGNAGNGAAAGTHLDNTASVIWEDGSGTVVSSDADSADYVEVVEPDLEVVKDVSILTGDAGDAVSYTITIQHTADSEADAFDVVLSDILPTQLTGLSASVTALSGGLVLVDSDLDLTGGTLQFAAGGTNTAADRTIDMAVGQAVTITVTGTLRDDVQAGEDVANTADIGWSSMDGSRTDYSGFVATGEDQERSYTDSDDADLSIATPSFDKALTDPFDTEFTIGETVSYDLIVTVPEGTTNAVVLNDDIPVGMSFLSASLVTDHTASQYLSSDFAGSVGSLNVQTTGADGADVSINLGNVVATGGVGTSNNQFVIRVVALVLDVAPNDGLLPGQTTLTNDADMQYHASDGSLITDGIESDLGDDSSTDSTVTVVEPELQIVKLVNGLPDGTALTDADAGDSVTYTFTVTHTGDSTSTAYDLDVSDMLPTEFDAASFTAAIDGMSVAGLFSIGGNSLTTTGTVDLQLGETLVITVTGTLLDVPTEAGETIPNTGNLNWSSVSGDGTDSGYISDGTDTERGDSADHSNGVYIDSDNAEIIIATPSFDKALTDPSDTEFTIGETVSYDLIVTVPEGTTNAVVLNDDIPAGMSFLSASLVTLAADSQYLNNNFSGSVASLNVTTTGTDGADVSIDLGNVVASGTTGTTANQFVIRVVALVLDVVPNDGLLPGQTTLTNDADMQYHASDGSLITDGIESDLGDDSSTDSSITVVEPNLQIVKDVDILGHNYGIAGDVASYTLVINHTAASDSDAHDVSIDDVLPSEFVVTGYTAVSSIFGSVAGNFQLSGQNFSTLTPLTLVQGETLTITFTGTISSSVSAASFVDNTANLAWSTVAEANEVDSPYIDDGTDGIDSDREYTDSDNAEFSVPDFEKEIVATSLADTGSGEYNAANEDLAIGEIVTYHLTATLPNGALVPTIISDSMPSNLEILSATVFSIGTDISGSSLLVGASGTVSGGTVSFDFGTVTVADDNQVDEDANRIVVEIQAVVRNDTTNNNDSDIKTNSAEFDFDGSAALTDSVTVDIVEPDPELTKTFYDAANSSEVEIVDAGDRVTVRLQITNSGNAPLYDAVASDTLDGFFDPTTVLLVGAPTHGFSFSQSGAAISFSGGTLQAGETVTLTFSVVVSQSVNPNTAVVNTATLTGDTLPTGHTGDNDHANYDRPYTETASDNLLTPNMSIEKAFVSSDNPDTPDAPADGTPDLNIGETATFHFLVTLPEGTLPSLEFMDLLPSGMQYVDGTARLILDTAALGETSPLGDVQFSGSVRDSGGALVSNGDFFNPIDVDAAAGDGNDVQIDFGQVVVSGQQGDTDRQFIVELQAVVLNTAGNQSGTNLVDTATVDVPGDGEAPVESNSEIVEVVDPVLDIVKRFYDAAGVSEVEIVPGGSTVTVSLSLMNSGTGPSYDLEVQDPLDPVRFNIASIAPAITPAGYTFSVSGNVITFRGDGAIMPGETVIFTYTVQVNVGFVHADNTATVTAGDTVPGDSLYERDHDGADDTDTIYEFVKPVPSEPVDPVIPFPEPPVDWGDEIDGDDAVDDFLEQSLWDTKSSVFQPSLLPIAPMYSGHAEPGTMLHFTIYDAQGNMIASKSSMTDTGGNWLLNVQSPQQFDVPHRIVIQQSMAVYNSSTEGGFNLRTYFSPSMGSKALTSISGSVTSIMAGSAEVVAHDLHLLNAGSIDPRWDSSSPYESTVVSTNPGQNNAL